MSDNTEFSILELFQEGLKMWERFAENPCESKAAYFRIFPDSPLRCAQFNCAGCEEVNRNCEKCRLLTEEEKRCASEPRSHYPELCCNGEYERWHSSHFSWTNKKISAGRIAERHRKALTSLVEEKP